MALSEHLQSQYSILLVLMQNFQFPYLIGECPYSPPFCAINSSNRAPDDRALIIFCSAQHYLSRFLASSGDWCVISINSFPHDKYKIISNFRVNGSATIACFPEPVQHLPLQVLKRRHPDLDLDMLEIDDTIENLHLWSQQELPCRINNDGKYYWTSDDLDKCEPRTCQVTDEMAKSPQITIELSSFINTHYVAYGLAYWYGQGDESMKKMPIPGSAKADYTCPNGKSSTSICSSNLYTPHWIGSCSCMLPKVAFTG